MSVGWSADFSYGYFKRILQAILSNFESHLLADVPEMQHINGHPQLILRHDVDVSLEMALEMAKIEREFGIRATYMVIPNSPFYCLEDGTARAIFRQLISMGHEVALHFDVSEEERKTNCEIHAVEPHIEAACKRLEQAIALPIRSISFHRPMPQFLHGPLMICGRVNAYAQKLMRWYLSDSKGCWREGEPLPKLLRPEKPLLQLLIHPIWWGDEHMSLEDRLQEFFNTETRGRSRHYSETFDANLAKTTLVRDVGGFISRRHNAIWKENIMQSNVAALKQRIHAHEQYGSRDLNEWILEHMQVAEGFSILDLGCGTGKQTLPLAHRVGVTGRVLAVDISQEALEVVSRISKEVGVEKRIDLLCTGMDDLDEHLKEQCFDRVLSAYALYYAQSPRTVLEVVHRILKTAGMLFFCGPARDNNAELKRFHYALRGEQPPVGSGWDVFMEEVGEPLARQLFAQVEVFTFQNPLRFDSAEALYTYWSSYGLYNETLDASFKAAAARHFQTHAVFETVKRVIGIKAIR